MDTERASQKLKPERVIFKRPSCKEEWASGSFANTGGIIGINSQRPGGKEIHRGGQLSFQNSALRVASKILGINGSLDWGGLKPL